MRNWVATGAGRANSTVVWLAVAIGVLTFVVVVLPGIVVKGPYGRATSGSTGESALQLGSESAFAVPVYITGEKRIETVPLETYVRNVVAAEMPAEFELEALKAQALAVRTYIVKRWLDQDTSHVPVPGALVTDTTAHQVYADEDQMKRQWGDKYAAYLEKLNRAVNETKDLILTYRHEPIQAAFFSTSNGYTENSEDYWQVYVPYLRSVPSPWDKTLSPKYKETVVFSLIRFASLIGIPASVPAREGNAFMQVLDTTEGHRIKTIRVAGKTMTGREMREKLNLNSSQFEWNVVGPNIEFTTYGYGHGVGMSQWGANGMAKEGKDAASIVKHYYQGIEIERVSALVRP